MAHDYIFKVGDRVVLEDARISKPCGPSGIGGGKWSGSSTCSLTNISN
jgi:hypothetical protein